jgi:hypothetical protein
MYLNRKPSSREWLIWPEGAAGERKNFAAAIQEGGRCVTDHGMEVSRY